MKKLVLFILLASLSFGATSLITGFELGTLGEGFGSLNTGSVQSVVVRSGAYAYRANPVSANQSIVFASRAAGGVLRQIFQSSRFYLRVAVLPVTGSVSIVKIGGSTTLNPEVALNADGTLTLADSLYPNLATSAQILSADGLWHRIEFVVGAVSGNGLAVYVDGILWASGGVAETYRAGTAISFGAEEAPLFVNASCDLYFDDILVDDGSFMSGLPGDSSIVLMEAAASGNQFTTASYSSAIPVSVTILGTEPVCRNVQMGHGRTNGSISTTANPVGNAYSFDFGDGFGLGVIVTDFGPIATNAVNMNQGADIAINMTSKSQEIVLAGLYVAYR